MNEELRKWNMQLFADDDPAPEEPEQESEGEGQDEGKDKEPDKLTLTQAELDEMIKKAKAKDRASFRNQLEKQLKAEQEEAETKAKMSAEDKVKYELEQYQKRVEELEAAQLKASLQKEAAKLLKDKAIGVDIDSMLVSQPDTGDQALEITDALVRSGAVDAVVVDSVAALVPRQEIEGEMGDQFVGLQARLMSQALRKLAGTISKTNCVVIFINQLRMKIGVMYGNPETTTGGNALKFYASVRLDVRRVEGIKEGGNVIGNHVRVKVVKNKVAPPFRQAEFDIMFGEGISKWGELVDMAVDFDIIQKAGSWFSMNGERIGQGKDSVKKYLMENPAIADDVEAQVRAKLAEATARPGAASQPAEAADRAVSVSAEDFDDEL